MAAHAILGASSSKRWMTCTPSARLELTVKTPEPESGFAVEGTVAHDLFEQVLGNQVGIIDDGTFETELTRIREICTEKGFDYDEMIIHVQTCSTFVRNYMQPGDTILLEKRVEYTRWVPEGFGTSDVVIYGNDRIHVLDLKYGKGLKVNAQDNSQMRIYALGTVQTLNVTADKVITTVMQPRLNHFDSEEMEYGALLRWANEEVVPAAQLAWKGAGDFKPGPETCRFCKAKAVCNARARTDVNEAINDFAIIRQKAPDRMTDAEVAKLMERAKSFVKWIEDAQEYLTKQAVAGDIPEGYKLERHSRSRAWTSKIDVRAKLEKLSVPVEDYMTKPDLKSVAQLETVLGRQFFQVHFGDLTEKHYGPPKLVKKEAEDGGAEDFA